MADKKISELTAFTTWADADLLAGVDDPGGSPETKKITWANTVASFPAASDTVAGKAELANVAETSAGSDTGRVVTPDGLGGSIYGTKTVIIKAIADDTVLTTGNGKTHFTIPVEFNGMNLVAVGAHVYTASSSGLPEVQLHNLTDTVDMLTTTITIDETEIDSKDATTAAVIDATHDDVATGDVIRIDVDTAGTDTTGMEIRLSFRMP